MSYVLGRMAVLLRLTNVPSLCSRYMAYSNHSFTSSLPFHLTLGRLSTNIRSVRPLSSDFSREPGGTQPLLQRPEALDRTADLSSDLWRAGGQAVGSRPPAGSEEAALRAALQDGRGEGETIWRPAESTAEAQGTKEKSLEHLRWM